MKTLINELLKEEEIGKLASAVEGGLCPAVITGVSPVHKAAALAESWLQNEYIYIG